MVNLEKHLKMSTSGKAEIANKIEGEGYRLTLLTECLIRVEVNAQDVFLDDATQAIINRALPKVIFEKEENGKLMLIKTAKATFEFNTQSLKLQNVYFGDKKVPCSNRGNLKGTYRTLDMCFSDWTKLLGNGLVSTTGVAVYDDSEGLIINQEGEIEPRRVKGEDYYVFAYGKDYYGAIKDFYRISGQMPLIPRFALGNWWSRYHAYTDKEYLDLMDKFIEKDIPITVATIDMDWHWVNIKKKFGFTQGKRRFLVQGSGWTGYSWNTELFPNHKDFLVQLHKRNLMVTLNLHPRDGLRWFEDDYGRMAGAMDIDPGSKKPVEFDITDNKFINNYFSIMHHGHEQNGVNFWWIDWQQGTKSKLKGLDPLWALNHFHFLDNGREGRRPLILSRYAGIGSHRYPLGFSGDTACNWKVLKFIPYFTSTATNVGYSWWSHDIGGHHFGRRDDELYIRWVQFGVFSPILRLHSTANELMGKEPWKQGFSANIIATELLRLRHRLIPYIYTLNYATHAQGEALIKPMYYNYPEEKFAYLRKYRNQYMFGKDLLVAPIVTKTCGKTGLAAVKAYIPRGRWTDIFTGQIYDSNGDIELVRDIASMPVLAREGTIIPLSDDKGNSTANPENLTVWAYRGNNAFDLYEDNGSDMSYLNGAYATTRFEIAEDKESGKVEFVIRPVEGDKSVTRAKRTYKIMFRDIADAAVSVRIGGKLTEKAKITKADCVCVAIENLDTSRQLEISLENTVYAKNQDYREYAITLLSKWQGKTIRKSALFQPIRIAKKKGARKASYLLAVNSSGIPKTIKKAINEQAAIDNN